MDTLLLVAAVFIMIKRNASESTKFFSFSLFPGIAVQQHVFCTCLWLNGRSEFTRLTQRHVFTWDFGVVGRSVVFAVFTGLNESKVDQKKKDCFAKAQKFESHSPEIGI